jgi:thiol-disulfide isomerase/thioredoxin
MMASNIVCAETTNSMPNIINDPDAAWNELQQAAQLPNATTDSPTEEFKKQHAALAVGTANRAREFYTRFPTNTNVIAAKKLQCKMLETAFFDEYDKRIFADWAAAQQTLFSDPKLTEADKFQLSLAIIQRKRFDRWLDPTTRDIEREKDIRELIENYPKQDQPYSMLLNLAAISPDTKARLIANETLTFPVSEEIKTKAEGILRRVDAVGKPLDIKFTALDGRQVDLRQMKGKVVLIDFWATWCGPCVGEIPHLIEAYEQFHLQGFEVIGVSFDSDREALQRFVNQNKLPWPQYFDGKVWKNKYGIHFGIARIPTMWLVDKNGDLRETNAGVDLKVKVQKLLSE